MRESEIERILVDRVKKLGGRAFKWVSPGNSGVPDRIVVLPGIPVIFIELKAGNGRLSPVQKVQVDRLKALGQEVRVLKGLPEVHRFLKECEERLHGV